MSKTSQRKVSMFQQGRKDALTDGWYRWKSHPMISIYHAGWQQGRKELREKSEKVVGYDNF